MKPFCVALFFALSACLSIQAEEKSDIDSAEVKALLGSYQDAFGHSATGLAYHNRLDGPNGDAVLSSPEEIARQEVRGKSMPWGYGSGIQDIALENGQVLFALCEAYDATGDEFFVAEARRLFDAMQILARISPEPGFVPRGPHPDGKSYYPDSSRDQHAAYIEALWRFGKTTLATEEDKAFIADTLDKIARRMEKNDWKIMNEDSSARAHVGFTWKQFTTVGAISLLSSLAQVADATGDPHWQELYQTYSDEKDGERWTKWLATEALEIGPPLTLYSNQFSQALTALRRIEKDPARKKQLAEFQRRWAERALEANVFDPEKWRRLDWAADRDEEETQALIDPLGLDLTKTYTVLDLYNGYDRSLWEHPDSRTQGVMHKLCFGLCTVALHGALLSDDPGLRERVLPIVGRMVKEFSEHHQNYRGGENFNRTVILGLLALGETPHAAAAAIPEMPVAKSTGWGPCMDVTIVGDRLYAIGKGKLYTADITDPKNPKKLGELSGLGNTRQIVVGEGIAYITAREDGVFIIDVKDPAKPTLLCHYDSIELATGVDLAGDILFVAQRHYGIEQVDVSDPKNPRHLSSIRTGEAQSIVYRDGFVYTGVWGSSEVVVVDMHDARSPKIVSKTPLDGYGDGLCVHDGMLYAATGHHSREAHREEGDPGYGRGHGLEIFDLSDPAKPTFVSRVKFPKFYAIGFDMWDVSVVNGHAFVADTHNGIFVVDVRDPKAPAIVGRTQLDIPEGKEEPALFGGLAVGDGVIYGAGGWTDLHLIDAPEIASPIAKEPGKLPVIGPEVEPDNERILATYRPGGQVWSVAMASDLPYAVAACGSAGIHVVRIGEGTFDPVSVVPTDDFTTCVCIQGRTVFAAEGTGGMSIWDLSPDGQLTRKGVYDAKGKRVRYVAVPEPGKHALLEVGSGRLHIVDLADPTQPRVVLEDSRHGLFYGYQLLDHLVEGRYAGAFWHVSGLHWYDLSTDPPTYQGNHPTGRFGMTEGLVPFQGKLLATRRRGYVRFDFAEGGDFTDLPVQRVPDTRLVGKPTLYENHLYVADRVFGRVFIVDMMDPDNPTLIDSFETPGNPGRIKTTDHGYLLPNGYEGLSLCRVVE